MKKKMALILLIAVTVSFVGSVPAFAIEDTYYNRTTYKFGRGLSNLIFSPLEIARSIDNRVGEYGFGPGAFIGLVHGIGRTVARVGSGAIDLVTFPVVDGPRPAYLMEPEFAFEITP